MVKKESTDQELSEIPANSRKVFHVGYLLHSFVHSISIHLVFYMCWYIVLREENPIFFGVLLCFFLSLFLPVKKLLICLAKSKARTSYPHIFQKSKILYLVSTALIIKYLWRFLVIGFDATHIIWFLKRKSISKWLNFPGETSQMHYPNMYLVLLVSN